MKIGLDSSVLVASVKRLGEKFHAPSLGLSKSIGEGGHEGVCSALVLTEVPGALASTKMPLDKVYEAEASVLAGFRVRVRPFEQYVDDALDLMLEFRELKRRLDINSADFHHIATAEGEGCDLFVTTDERHLLREDIVHAFSSRIAVRHPAAALGMLQ
ncbi:MAG: type II toxin-antitoxin system VapC family toxin [Nitrososphaerota archaeon]|nr:PIN domain-containing protein [Nitrososphaerota archaeon]MDG6909669.1 type II toxin-antitoxin system VapC family toxin [Nitrososphaerota archaeon]MDG6937527.1 type II toxin-antitoxin system VapC family toxin [Nitrososphaerota archaeon]MDG6961669.1 type II toxin-antitoxin system VapC family toxin [Nitrososphaerota archaeon]MDG7034581.1 type II toxin-antitoxin system VapC family toxin [Nitrososphaerota archaeon]